MLIYFNHFLEAETDLMVSDSAYRIYQPARAIGEADQAYVFTGIFNSELGHQALMHADVLVTDYVNHPDFFKAIVERKKNNKKTFLEIFDYLFDQNHFIVNDLRYPGLNFFSEMNILPWIDGIITVSDGLYLKYKKYHPNVKTIPNFILDLPNFNFSPKKYIGWGGSYSHKYELDFLCDLMDQFLQHHQGYSFSIKSGIKKHKSVEYLIKNHEKKIVLEKPGTLYDYYRFLLEKVGIGLIFLEDKLFNFCRSDIKFIEYAAHSIPVFLNPYFNYKKSIQDNNSFLYISKEDFHNKINFSIKNPQVAQEKSFHAYQYVAKYRQERENIKQRLNFFDVQPGLKKHSRKLFHSILSKSNHKDIIFYKNCVFKTTKGYESVLNKEQDILHGLKASKYFIKHYPYFYYSYIFHACYSSEKDTCEKSLKKAYTLNPQSPWLFSIWAKKCIEWGQYGRAKAYFEKAIHLSPYDPSLYVNFANHYIKRGGYLNAQKLLEKASHLNPYAFHVHALMGVNNKERLKNKKNNSLTLKELEQAIYFHPVNHYLRLFYAEALYQAGKTALSYRQLKRLYEENPKDKWIQIHLQKNILEQKKYKLLKSINKENKTNSIELM